MFKKIGLILAMSISAFAMHNAQININQKDLEFDVNLDMGQYNTTVEPDTTFVGVNYLKGSSDNSKNQSGSSVNTKYFFEASFLIMQEIRETGLKIGLGIKTNFSNFDDTSFVAIPLGLEVSYRLPIENLIPIYIGSEVYYAPESLSFSNAKNYLAYRIGLELEVIERASIFVGYRNIETNYDVKSTEYDVTYNKSGYFGFKFKF